MKHLVRALLLAGLLAHIGSQSVAAKMTHSEIIEAPGPEGVLAGTALGPHGANAPVVLIVPGSGPTDRDGNSPLGVRASTYRLIAEGLAARGIRSVRVDKRGMFGSARAISDANAVTIEDYATDIHTWVATIRKTMGVSCVWVLGHSEGALSALIAAQKAEGICGLLLISAAGRRVGDVLREQIRANPSNAPIHENAAAVIRELEAGQQVQLADIHPDLHRLFRPEVQRFLMSTFARDPAKLLATYAGPVLILHGLRDIQVGRADAERLHRSRPGSDLIFLADANHVLKPVASDDRAANLAAYQDSDRPLAEGAIEALASFIGMQMKVR